MSNRKTKTKTIPSYKSCYDAAWYDSNKSYKKLVMRIRYRAKQFAKTHAETTVNPFVNTLKSLREDRKRQIAGSRLLNEVTNLDYLFKPVCEIARDYFYAV